MVDVSVVISYVLAVFEKPVPSAFLLGGRGVAFVIYAVGGVFETVLIVVFIPVLGVLKVVEENASALVKRVGRKVRVVV